MEDQILHQGPGYTIARTFKALTLVPYGPAERENGMRNYGWVDLRDRPEYVAEIPEARKSEGLAKLLRVVAAPGSKVMSGGCECGAFSSQQPGEPRWHVSGYVDVMFKDAERNIDPQNLVNLACTILNGITASTNHYFTYEMLIEPLKLFFGRTDCHSLMIKVAGVGADEATAWSAFNYAIGAAADAITRNRERLAAKDS